MTNQELYKQAILDAKAVRETALAAAKQSLSEAFEPRIKEMMRIKLSEELEDGNDLEETPYEMEEAMYMADEGTMKDENAEMVDENTLDEILAELNAISEEMENESELEEGHIKSDGYVGTKGKGGTGYDEKARTTKGDHKLHEAEDDEDAEEADTEAGAVEGGEEASDDETVVDITVGELKDIIRDVFTQLQGGEMEMGGDEMEPASDEENGAINLDGEPQPDEMEEISLDEILAELEKDQMEEEAPHPAKHVAGNTKNAHSVDEMKKDKMKKDLEEANRTVKVMQTELNEINLLNAKLLYFNKILKAKSLNESQKVKVMNAFDRATNVKEVENTYATLTESIIAAPKKTALKESLGFASKPIGSAPARPIVEVDAFVSRWQTLAGIK